MWNDPNAPYPPNTRAPQYQGYGGYHSPDQDAQTEPIGRSDDDPPPYSPAGPQYPAGRPPQWPDRDARTGHGPVAAPRQPYTDLVYPPGYTGNRETRREYRVQAPVAAPPRDERSAAYPAPRHDERAAPRPQGRSLPHLPIAHLFLIVGVAAMALALTRPWGISSQGSVVYINNFNSATLSAYGVDLGSVAIQTATYLVMAAGALSLALILTNTLVLIINKLLGLIGLSGLASLVFFPALWGLATLLFLALVGAAGFGGLDALSQLPAIQSHGITGVDVSQHSSGYYLWWGGIIATFIGMLGQLALRRR